MMAENKTGVMRPFGISDKVGYMLGDLGNDFTFLLSSGFLMKFYTDVMEVPGAIVGLAMAVSRILDAFTDVAMGRICDRSRQTPAGKFKPWLRRMCAPVAISSFLIYQSSMARAPMTMRIIWLFVTYILWGSIFYTSINIPYGSMASAISPEPSDRQSLSTWRSVGAALAGLVLGAGIPLIAYDTVNGQQVLNGGKFTVIAGVGSALAVVFYLLCYHLTTERVQMEHTGERMERKFSTLWRSVLTDRALLSVVAAAILLLVSQLTIQSMANYVYPNYYVNVQAQSVFSILVTVLSLACAAAVKPLSEKFGKKEVSAAASAFSAIAYGFLFLLHTQSVAVYIFVSLLGNLGLAMFNMVCWAMITDVIDAAELRNGVREDGTVYAIYSFSRKLGQAASSGLSGWLLTLAGYRTETATDPTVLRGIYDISTLLPAGGFALLAIVLAIWYPLGKKQVQENNQNLQNRKKG